MYVSRAMFHLTSVEIPPTPTSDRFFSWTWTGSSHLLLMYEEQSGTVFMFVYRQLVTGISGGKYVGMA